MGRRFSRPEVVLDNGEFRITRVSDPDDEFAETQYLTEVSIANNYPDVRLTWVAEPYVQKPWASPNLHVATAVLGGYLAGVEDAEESVSIRSLYSY